jgi:hypothetical protein
MALNQQGGIPQTTDDSSLGAPSSSRVPFQGMMQMKSVKQMMAEDKAQAQQTNNSQIVQGLAGHVRKCFNWAKTAKQQTVEQRILQSIRQRRGEYDPDVLARIREQGGSDIYMNITSVKCRGAVSWLRDVFLATANDKPWKLEPTPIPDLPPDYMESVITKCAKQLSEAMMMNQAMQDEDVQELLIELKAQQLEQLQDQSKEMVELMEKKMEDQLDEGGFTDAFSQFLDDLVTFPSAIIKGPIVVNKPKLQWVSNTAAQPNVDSPLDGTTPDGQGADTPMPMQHPQSGGTLQVVDQLSLEWKRVDPFRAYPSPSANDINDGYFIEHHQLSRSDLEALLGVPGYSDGAIRGVLDDYGRGGLREWLTHEMVKAEAEGKLTTAISYNEEGLIDALQYWGSVQGKMLIEWGMDEKEITDPLKEYHCEVWVIGTWVIKVTLNYDPLARKPYYKTSYETIPGTFWGNSVCDLVRDCQTMCNNAARAMSNNMGIASGPQVAINIERLPAGANVTEMYPWKIWQVTSDPMGSTQPPMQFFQPDDHSSQLMAIYEKYAELADEYSGVPRYMTGTDGTPGAGRTASGLSMMINNAGKVIKQVINNVDQGVITPLLERLYFYNMRYGQDESLKGDVNVIARGTLALIAQEAAQVRRNEFLQLVLNSPIAQQVVDIEGTAALLRENAKTLDMDVDKIVPNTDLLRRRIAQKAMAMQQAAAAQQQGSGVQTPAAPPAPDGAAAAPPAVFPNPRPQPPMPGKPTLGAGPMRPNGQPLQNGAPQTDHFSPAKH